MPNNNSHDFGFSYLKPVYYGGSQSGTLEGNPVGIQVALHGMALIAANSPYGSNELTVRFEESHRPLSKVLSVLENIITSVESIYDNNEPDCKDLSGFTYRLIKQLGINVNEFINDNKTYSLHDVEQIIESFPVNLIKVTVIAPVAH